MSVFKDEEIAGYYINRELVCRECIENADLQNVKADDILTQDEMKDDEFYFCDRCKERIERIN